MVHDIFISYAKEDRGVADKICANLENEGIACWIAPRDIAPGEKYATAIIHAIENAKIVVVIFSRNSDQSAHVRTEIERAFNQGKTIIPFRVENIEPSDEIQYFIGSRQWLDAYSGHYEEHARQLAQILKNRLTPDSIVPGSQEPPSPKNSQSTTAYAKTENEFAEIGPRLNRSIAYGIDLGLSIIVGIVFFFVIVIGMYMVLGGSEGYNKIMSIDGGVTNSALGNFVVSISILVGMLVFLVFFESTSPYRSPGKRLFSLKIIRSPVLSPSGTWRILRSLIKNIPLMVVLIATGFQSTSLGIFLLVIGFILVIIWAITLFVTSKSQSVHDLVTGTFVVVYHKR
jgi:uncharacterized RDD family membrane protein YckC